MFANEEFPPLGTAAPLKERVKFGSIKKALFRKPEYMALAQPKEEKMGKISRQASEDQLTGTFNGL